jgi:hypothetical protein
VAKQTTINLSPPKGTSHSRGRARAATTFTLFVGIGLSVFLFLTRSCFDFPFFSAATLCFDISGIFLLQKIGWHGLVSRSVQRRSSNSLLFLVLFLLWASFFGAYFAGPNFEQLRNEGQTARIESSDPSCSPRLLRSLAKKPDAVGSAALTQDPTHQGVCTVQWTRVVDGFKSRSCLQLESNSRREYYCLTHLQILYRFASFESNGIHYGDLIVARTAFGRPSAFLCPSKTFTRLLFDPRGEIAKTTEDPEQKYSEHLESTFTFLFWYLSLGSVFLIGLVV